MWIMIFLLVFIFWIVRFVSDLDKTVKATQEQQKHSVSPSYLAHFTEMNNIRQLKRIRNAYRRALNKESPGFDFEIQKEIDQLKTSVGGEEGTVYDSDSEHPPAHAHHADVNPPPADNPDF